MVKALACDSKGRKFDSQPFKFNYYMMVLAHHWLLWCDSGLYGSKPWRLHWLGLVCALPHPAIRVALFCHSSPATYCSASSRNHRVPVTGYRTCPASHRLRHHSRSRESASRLSVPASIPGWHCSVTRRLYVLVSYTPVDLVITLLFRPR